jgi:predicted amidohydrolase YtcJ
VKGLLIRDCTLLRGGPASVHVEGGRIVQVASPDLPVPSGAEVIEANGGALLPGLIDSHCHPFEYGWLKRSVDLRGASNMVGVRLRLQAGVARAKPGDWVTGMGWDQERFPDRRMPSRADIDDISPSNPVALTRICGHIALLNTRAVDELGLASRTGSEYERDPGGFLTGVVKESALTDVFGRIPRSEERCAADLQAVEVEAARAGLTTMHCILSPEGYREELAALMALDSAGSLSLRYRVYIPPEAMDFIKEKGLRAKLAGDRLRMNGVKVYADGSLGARTAALREPYADDPSNLGILRHTDEELSDVVAKADAEGYQVIVHAIGDRAVEQAVLALSSVSGGGNPRRHRIEHASLLPRDLRGKMAKVKLRATVQPLFITSDTWASERLGEERVRDLYPLRSLLEDGIIASGSSDSPVESLNPILGMWASMTRGGSALPESLGLEAALSLYTSNASSNGHDDAGELVEGAPANLTLLDSSIEGIHPALLRKVGVLATVVDGTLVHCYGPS